MSEILHRNLLMDAQFYLHIIRSPFGRLDEYEKLLKILDFSPSLRDELDLAKHELQMLEYVRRNPVSAKKRPKLKYVVRIRPKPEYL